MRKIEYRRDVIPSMESVRSLYEDAGWDISDMPRLMEAIRQSLLTITAWDEDKLAGLIRIVGDGLTVIYIQDLLVLRSCKRNGIGTSLVRMVCEEYHHVRQKVLLTDDTVETRDFYESLGFHSCDQGNLVSFVKMG